ncbi:nucleotidyltransferase domain-containing protein [Ancylobacter sonchi]|nr:nucleotidyltransferase domain-containing protein [Ancylobacter sonchi]
MRHIPPDFSAESLREIDRRLTDLECQEDATLLLAVESGSRAWGFASPDSDFDCRFIFVRRIERYLSLSPPRDVIELPTDGVFDINGWDLAKTLKLMLKGNVTALEWLQSPINYAGSEHFRDELLAFARRHTSRDLVARHYLYLGLRQRRACFSDRASVPLKRLFYALRPAAALRWLRLHPQGNVPPMHFPTLMAETSPPPEIRELVAALIAEKARTHELGTMILPEAISCFVDTEFDAATRLLGQERNRSTFGAEEEANALLRRWIGMDGGRSVAIA